MTYSKPIFDYYSVHPLSTVTLARLFGFFTHFPFSTFYCHRLITLSLSHCVTTVIYTKELLIIHTYSPVLRSEMFSVQGILCPLRQRIICTCLLKILIRLFRSCFHIVFGRINASAPNHEGRKSFRRITSTMRPWKQQRNQNQLGWDQKIAAHLASYDRGVATVDQCSVIL